MGNDGELLLYEFDKIKNNYLEFEKKIWELAAFYKEEPSEFLKKTIVDLCSIAKGQIVILYDLLPKVYDKTAQATYESILKTKENDIFEISNAVLRNNQK